MDDTITSVVSLTPNTIMGVSGLWDILKPAAQTHQLSVLSVSERFADSKLQHRALIVGIDASIWINRAVNGLRSVPGTGWNKGRNCELSLLFQRILEYLPLNVVLVFVFNGFHRPVKKRGQTVKKSAHWIENDFMAVIAAFGYHSHRAPGEAEAELAELNKRGIVDLIITDDSDSFLFGSTHVVCGPIMTGPPDTVQLYSLDAIRSHQDIMLTDEGIFLMAILSGGDYSKGLPGCRPSTAHQLASSSLGTQLLLAARTLSKKSLRKFLSTWREELRTKLAYNKGGYLSRVNNTAALNVTEDFPDLDTVLLYAKPLTSWSTGQTLPPCDEWTPRLPMLSQLSQTCERYFSWGSTGPSTWKKIGKELSHGFIVTIMVQAFKSPDNSNENVFTRTDVSHTIAHKPGRRFCTFEVMVDRKKIRQLVTDSYNSSQSTAEDTKDKSRRCSVTIPGPILLHACSEMVLTFLEVHGLKITDVLIPSAIRVLPPQVRRFEDVIDISSDKDEEVSLRHISQSAKKPQQVVWVDI